MVFTQDKYSPFRKRTPYIYTTFSKTYSIKQPAMEIRSREDLVGYSPDNSPAGEQRILPWRRDKGQAYKHALREAQYSKYYIVDVEDNSDSTSVEKRFTLQDAQSHARFYVIISRILRCSCGYNVCINCPLPSKNSRCFRMC